MGPVATLKFMATLTAQLGDQIVVGDGPKGSRAPEKTEGAPPNRWMSFSALFTCATLHAFRRPPTLPFGRQC